MEHSEHSILILYKIRNMELRISLKGFKLQITSKGGNTISSSNGAGRVFTLKRPYMTDVEDDHIKIHYKVGSDYGYYQKITFVSETKVVVQHFHLEKRISDESTWDFARYKEEECYMKNGKEIV